MKFLRPVLLVAACGLFFLAIAGFIWRKKIVKLIVPKIEKVKTSKINVVADSADVYLELILKNKPFIKFHLTHVLLSASNNDLQILKYENNTSIVLNKNEERAIPLRFKLPIDAISKQIADLKNVDSTAIKLSGSLTFSTFFGEIIVPIDQLIDVKVPVPPIIKLKEVIYNERIDDLYMFDAIIEIINNNNKRLALKNITYEFTGEDMIYSAGTYKKDVIVEAAGRAQVKLPVKIRIHRRLRLLSKIILDNDIINYHFFMKGTIVTIAGITEQIPVSFNKRGKLELRNENKKQNIKFRKSKSPHKKSTTK